MSEALTAPDFSTIPVGPLALIALPGCEELAAKIDAYLKTWREIRESEHKTTIAFSGYQRDSYLIKAAFPRFGSGESKCHIQQSVRGYDIFIVCDMFNYGLTYKMYGKDNMMSPDDHYANLKRAISAIGGKARRITVIMPMLYEGRQHKRSSRESLDCAMALQELSALGVDNLITFDAHDPRVQNAIPLTGFESFMPTYQMLKALCRRVNDLHFDKQHMMIVSPDEGAINRNIFYSSVLGLDMGMFYKRRDYSKVVDGRNRIVAHEYMGDPVEGKDIIVADDIIASGDSMLGLLDDLKKRNAGRIFIAATFCFFTNGTQAFEEVYRSGKLAGVMGTNLTYLPDEVRKAPWFIEVDMSKYMAYIIATLNHDHSLDALLNSMGRIVNLLERYNRGEKI